MPGITYERQERLVRGQPVVVHVVTAPKHGGLYKLRPLLSNGTVLGHRTLPSMQRSMSSGATTVGVNGDFFNTASGRPSGIFLRDGVLSTKPNRGRSALAIGFDGTLLVDIFRFAGSWQVAGFSAHPLEEVNAPMERPPGVALYTPQYGGPTPHVKGAVEVVLAGFPKALLNGNLSGRVTAIRRNGGHWVPPGGAILFARGQWRDKIREEAPVGTDVTVRLSVNGLPDDAADAIGGGPLLVRDGAPVRQADEEFRLSQLVPRHPRTAIGQLADGRTLFVVADGRSASSLGVSNADMAVTMASLGAVTAMGFDGGGSSTLSFGGKVLNRPSDGSTRAVANGLVMQYFGIYAPPVPLGRLTPNGDGVTDSTVVSARIARRSTVDLVLRRPNGSVAWRVGRIVSPGWFRRTVGAKGMREGSWTWSVEATETGTGRTSRMKRRFVVDRTLGHLRLSVGRITPTARRGRTVTIAANLTRRARLAVTVRRPSGAVVRVLNRGETPRGKHTWKWDGRGTAGRVVRSGRYTVRVAAVGPHGTSTLARHVRVVR